MAEEALWVKPDGEYELVRAEDLSDNDRDKDFICCGVSETGELCAVNLGLSYETPNKARHFYLKTMAIKHKPGCPKCRERGATFIARLDRSGKGTTDEKLFEQINRDKATRHMPKKEEPSTDEENKGTVDIATDAPPEDELKSGTNNNTQKEIRISKRHPRNLEELIALLRSLSVNQQYANRRVFDWILDERTVEGYRRFGHIPEARPIIISARKTIPPEGVYLKNNQWMLKDFWGWRGKEFFFILELDEEAKQKLWNLCNITPAAQIIVWAVFRKHPTLPRTYISEPVKAKMINAEITQESMQYTH